MIAVAEVKVTGKETNKVVTVCVEISSEQGCKVAERVSARDTLSLMKKEPRVTVVEHY